MRRVRQAVVGAACLALGLAVVATLWSGRSAGSARQRADRAAALQLAVGGMDEAIVRLRKNPHWEGIKGRDLGLATLDVVVRTPEGVPGAREVESSCRLKRPGSDCVRRVRATLNEESVPAVFDLTVAAREKLEMRAGVMAAGDVHSNGLLTLNDAGVRILGRASLPGEAEATQARVQGGIQTGVPPMTFPEIDPEFKWRALEAGTRAQGLTVGDGRGIEGRIQGDLRVQGPRGARLSGVVWVTGNLEMSGPLQGRGALVVDGSVRVQSGFRYEFATHSSVLLIGTSAAEDAIRVRGSGTVRAYLYAPYGGLEVDGPVTIDGGVAGESVRLHDGAAVKPQPSWTAGHPALPRVLQVTHYEER